MNMDVFFHFLLEFHSSERINSQLRMTNEEIEGGKNHVFKNILLVKVPKTLSESCSIQLFVTQ